jgi:hypothetical protein
MNRQEASLYFRLRVVPYSPVPPNKALQPDKGKLSCLLHSQEPRQLAVAAELGR